MAKAHYKMTENVSKITTKKKKLFKNSMIKKI